MQAIFEFHSWQLAVRSSRQWSRKVRLTLFLALARFAIFPATSADENRGVVLQ